MSNESKHLTVADIIREACEQYGAGGLCDGECGCGIDDIRMCECPMKAASHCFLAKRIECLDVEGECDCDGYHYVPLAIPDPWLDAPDGPGWWWKRGVYEGEVSTEIVFLREYGGRLCIQNWQYLDGYEWQRVQPPRRR